MQKHAIGPRADSLRYVLLAGSLLVLIAVSIRGADGPAARPKANYELAARWMPAKVGKLVFDLTVTPHWLDRRPLLVFIRELERP